MNDTIPNPPRPQKKRYKFLGCEIIYREACYLAATGYHQVDVNFMLKGLHDLTTKDMLQKLQAEIDAVDPDTGYEAILLGYARCNDGLVGLTSRSIPMVIPRAHDCITFFFGSRSAYQEYFETHPGTYFATTGWTERNETGPGESGFSRPAYGLEGVMAKLGLTESYSEMVEKYGKEGADFIIESMGGWTKHYSHGLYLDMEVCDETHYIEQARKLSEENNWNFEVRKGDWSLLKKLFNGDWDEDFLVIPPGKTIAARNDDSVLGLEE
jgi:hypothetical protein